MKVETEMQIMKDKMEELKGAAVEDKMSILALKDDNKKVFQKLQEFRKEYSELVNSKGKPAGPTDQG